MDLYTKNALKCSEVTTRSYSTSFSSGIVLLNKKYRDAIFAIYGYVRFADEIVDTFHNHNKSALLHNFREVTFEAIRKGMSTNPILHSFQYVVNRFGIDSELIEAFLQSMEMDLSKKTFTRQEYQQYIYGSAEVIGLMCMKVFYEGDAAEYERLKRPARKLGEAFQKVNFLRDMKADWEERGRVYFPGVDYEKFSVSDKKAIEAEILDDLANAYKGIKLLKKEVQLGVFVAYRYYLHLYKIISQSPVQDLLNNRLRVDNRKKLLLLAASFLQFKAGRI